MSLSCLCLVLSLSLLKFRLNLNLNQVFMGAHFVPFLALVVRLHAGRWGYGPGIAWAGFPVERGCWMRSRAPPGEFFHPATPKIPPSPKKIPTADSWEFALPFGELLCVRASERACVRASMRLSVRASVRLSVRACI